MVSGTKMLATDTGLKVSCDVGPPCMGLICPKHPLNAGLDLDLGNLEPKSILVVVLKLFLAHFCFVAGVTVPSTQGFGHWDVGKKASACTKLPSI